MRPPAKRRARCRCRNAPTASGTASCPAWRWGNCTDCAPSGPWQPAAGHRFNAAKLLIDPYARELVGGTTDLSNEVAWTLDASGQEQPDPHDNAARMPKARVVDLERELAAGAAIAPGPRIAPEHTVIYEAHVKGLTRLHPGVPEPLRGTYAGLASAATAGALPEAGHHHPVPAAGAASHRREAPARRWA